MKEATEVRARTAAFADLALESVMNPFLIGSKDGGASARRIGADPCRWDE
jgi:hypothetical protein